MIVAVITHSRYIVACFWSAFTLYRLCNHFLDIRSILYLEGEGKIKNLKLRIVKEEPEKSFIRREISYTHGSSQTRKVYQFQVFFKLYVSSIVSVKLFKSQNRVKSICMLQIQI